MYGIGLCISRADQDKQLKGFMISKIMELAHKNGIYCKTRNIMELTETPFERKRNVYLGGTFPGGHFTNITVPLPNYAKVVEVAAGEAVRILSL